MIRHKRGDTFDQLLLLPVADFPNGYFIGWTVASQIRTQRNRLIANFVVSWADPAADTRTLRLFAADTEAWPIGNHEIDVQFTRTSDGLIRSTETIPIEVLKDITILPDAP